MKKYIISILVLSTVVFSQSINLSKDLLNGEKYITGDDGIVRIQVNVWGHVKNPGTFLIYDGANLIDALSLAGGPLIGADLKNLKIISDEKPSKAFNLKRFTDVNSEDLPLINPSDTIIVEPTKLHLIFSRSNKICYVFFKK